LYRTTDSPNSIPVQLDLIRNKIVLRRDKKSGDLKNTDRKVIVKSGVSLKEKEIIAQGIDGWGKNGTSAGKVRKTKFFLQF